MPNNISKEDKNRTVAKILPRRESRAFGSINVYPKKVTFETQNPGEEVYILARAHVITNIGWIFRVAALSTIPLFLLYFVDYFNVSIDFIPYQLTVLMLVAYYLSLVALSLMNLMNWYYNIYLVTSDRVMDYDFRAMAAYKVSEAEIENIQDVSQMSIGFFPTMFGYGDILIQTASSRNKFYFRAVPKPAWIRDVIVDLASLVRTNEP